ncbi:MAG TPA: hypothetical protein VNE19_03165 [Methylomirabilota bacterium]|nr:hypothetical protein [Methylomirabilota bacterium]
MQPVELVATVGQNYHNTFASEPAREIRQQFKRGGIGEMDILDSEDERFRTRQIREEHGERLMALKPVGPPRGLDLATGPFRQEASELTGMTLK